MSKENQKEKIKKRIREKTPKKIGDIPWAFFDFKLCSRRLTERNAAMKNAAMKNAAMKNAAMKNEEWRMKNEELSASPIKKRGSTTDRKATVKTFE